MESTPPWHGHKRAVETNEASERVRWIDSDSRRWRRRKKVQVWERPERQRGEREGQKQQPMAREIACNDKGIACNDKGDSMQ
eukprot:16471-Rhodomonas_salina.1